MVFFSLALMRPIGAATASASFVLLALYLFRCDERLFLRLLFFMIILAIATCLNFKCSCK